MSTALALKLIITLLGLTLPGYALARLLRLQYPGFAAFPFSALIICQSITTLTICNSRITFSAIAVMLAVCTALCGVMTPRRGIKAESPADTELCADSFWRRSALTVTILLLLAMAFRAILYPLGGFDTFTRWNALAREMVQYSALSFYPPVTGADFSIYTMPDGFPPLVASVYWWIYASTGLTLPQLSVISVILQFTAILGLTWTALKITAGEKAASFSLLALAASPLLIQSVQIGQETGFLIIAVAGQICFALAATRRTTPGIVAAAALFAALAALTRDYGPALALPGLLVLIFEPTTRRHAWKYALLAALIACPWYIRNWVITGNPLYPFSMPGATNPNQLLTAVLHYYGEIFGIGNFGVREWLAIGYEIILGGSITLLAGLAFLEKKGRNSYAFTLSLLFITLLWLWSIGKTSGGVLYSLRVLAPAIVILALIAGKALAEIPKNSRLRRLSWLLLAASLWGVLSALSFPLGPMSISTTILSQKGEAPEFCEANMEFAKKISTFELPATGILTDSPYLAVILKRETRFRPVIIWSSEVSSAISPLKSHAETMNLLKSKEIRLVAMNRTSLHNDLLFKTPFYREGVKKWKEVTVMGDWVLFAITPQEE